ncbi:hypothetical protein MW887_010967 [Aspergillus wentii]|nr:hypothetical protein MW887_010967 [Aspergillus wentii]
MSSQLENRTHCSSLSKSNLSKLPAKRPHRSGLAKKKAIQCYYYKEFGHRKNTCPRLLQRQQEERTVREATGSLQPQLILKIIDNPNGNEIMQHIPYAEVIKISGGPDPVTKAILSSIDPSIQELEDTKVTAKALQVAYKKQTSFR